MFHNFLQQYNSQQIIPKEDVKIGNILDLEFSLGDALLAIAIASLLVMILRLINKLIQPSTPFRKTVKTIDDYFPNALTNEQLCTLIKKNLERHDYGKDSLVATSFCCDEVNRSFEIDLSKLYGPYFAFGGLAGCKKNYMMFTFLNLSKLLQPYSMFHCF
jgi:Limiting CO2-inducible proteins B/C beta carbonyic anhydrases